MFSRLLFALVLAKMLVGTMIQRGWAFQPKISPRKLHSGGRHNELAKLNMIDPVAASVIDDIVCSASTFLSLSTMEVNVSPEPIHTAFSVATFFPQPFWLLMIFLPNSKITKQIMGGLGKKLAVSS
jgi:hypothetical protein